MQRQIQEIQYLATKYSKAALGRMVQLGLLDAQKAMMAGMMIQRIEQQNAKPPQTTVAQEVLGLPAVAMGPQNQPSQVGPSSAPTTSPPVMTAADGGLLNIPAGDVGEYAGGGIVAFDDGGEVEGYAGGGVVAMAGGGMEDFRRDPASRVNPRVQAQRDQERQRILMQELEDARARLARGDPRAQGDVDALTRDLRRMVPKPSADAGITSLIPSAQAGGTDVSSVGGYPETGTSFLSALSEKDRADYAAGKYTTSPVGRFFAPVTDALFGASYTPDTRNALIDIDKQYNTLFQQRRELTGAFGFKGQTPEQRAQVVQIDKQMADLSAKAKAIRSSPTATVRGATEAKVASVPAKPATPPAEPAPSSAYSTKQNQSPLQGSMGETPPAPVTEDKPAPEAPAASKIKRPELSNLSFEDYIARATPKVGTLNLTKEKSLKEVGDERRKAEAAAGYDEGVFNKMIDKIEKKKGTAASEKDIAFGQFLMTTGLEVFGAREGEEFEKLGKGGQKGLLNYQEAMKDLKARQEKYDERIESLRMADLQARRTGLDSDIRRRDSLAEQAQADRRAVFQAENNAANAGVNAAANLTVAQQNNLMQLYNIDVQEKRAQDELKLRGKELDLRGRQLDVTSNYYTGLLKAQEDRNKALGANAQAKYLGAKQKILDGMSSDPRYAAFVKDLKGRYGDNWANIPKAQTEFSNFQKMYLGQKLEAMGAFDSDMPGVQSAYDLLAE